MFLFASTVRKIDKIEKTAIFSTDKEKVDQTYYDTIRLILVL